MKKRFILMGMVLFIALLGVAGVIPMGDDEHIDIVYGNSCINKYL